MSHIIKHLRSVYLGKAIGILYANIEAYHMKYYTLSNILFDMYNNTTLTTTDTSGTLYLDTNSCNNYLTFSPSYTLAGVNKTYGLVKSHLTDESALFTFFLPGSSKENIKVTYLEEEGSFKVEAKNDYGYQLCETYRICKNKHNLSEIECVIKNGILTVTIPVKKEARPKQVKLT